MIFESAPWRVDLLRDAALIERWARRSPSERQQYLLEKKLFLSAFAMRKLSEARKIPDALPKRSMRAISYPTIRKPTHFNWHRVEKNFDLNAGENISTSSEIVIKQIIHSYVFVFEYDNGECVSRLLIASEFERDRRLLSISLRDYIDLCREFATAEVSEIHWQLDPKRGEVMRVV